MPVVNIQLIEGRSKEVKAAIAKEITKVFLSTLTPLKTMFM